MRYVLVGNYGTGNFGDEALKEYFLTVFRDSEWRVLSAHPHASECPRLPGGLRSLLQTPWWKTLAALHSSDGMVFGGGTLFTDTESIRACLLWWWHGFIAWLLRKKIILAYQGIGPFKTGLGEWCARFVVARAAFISVRDPASAHRVESWKKNTKVIQSFDPVFSLYREKNMTLDPKNVFTIIPRHNSSDSFEQSVRTLQAKGPWSRTVLLSLAPDDPREQAVCRSLAAALSLPESSIVPVRSVDTLLTEVRRAGFVLAQRFHGALAALALGVPFAAVAQREGDKLSTLSQTSVTDAVRLVEEGEQSLRRTLFTGKRDSAIISP